MRFIARFAMRGPYHAAVSAALAQLASLQIGLLIVISGAIVALSTLSHGSREGLRVLVLATAVVVALRVVLGGEALPLLVLSLVVWLPAWLMAINLRRKQQQGLPLLMVAVLVGAYAIAMRLAVGDVSAFWGERLELLFDNVAAQSGARFSAEQIDFIAAQMHVWSLVGMFCMLAGMLLLARWWQAVLTNPGGFGSEFRELRLPWVALLAAALTAVLMLGQALTGAAFGISGDAFVIVVVSFAFQGLAVIHARVRALRLAAGWLVGLYVMLVVTPHVVGPVLATTGVADALGDFRGLRRAAAAADAPPAADDNADTEPPDATGDGQAEDGGDDQPPREQ